MENKSLKRVHPPAFKAKVAIEAIKGEKTLMVKIKGNYGLSVSASRLALNQDKDIVSVPLSFFLLT